MKAKEQVIEALNELKPEETFMVYDLILSLKSKVGVKNVDKSLSAYLKARKALRQCKGSLSKDILKGREDRMRASCT